MQLTATECEHLRSALADWPLALRGPEAIEACDGDVEDAAIDLALKSGLEPDTCDRWLEGLAKRFRPVLCDRQRRSELASAALPALLELLTEGSDCPPLLALPVALLVREQGVERFCRSFDEKLA